MRDFGIEITILLILAGVLCGGRTLPCNLRRKCPLPRNRALTHALIALSLGACFLCAAAASVLLHGYPAASVHDEFSYLLMADTFRLGRFSNPSPPSPLHFETFHVLVEPRYASKYQPGQGIFLAAGQTLLGHPAWGSVIATCFAGATLFFLLRTHVRRSLALVVTLLFALHTELHHQWTDSYWGGQLAFAGGALVIAAMQTRAARDVKARSVALAVGGSLLFFTRPFEGAVLFGISIVGILISFVSSSRSERQQLARGILPFVLATLPFVIFTGAYNRDITGSALNLPYRLYEQTHSTAPIFRWGKRSNATVPEIPEFERYDNWSNEAAVWHRYGKLWWLHKSEVYSNFLQFMTDDYRAVWLIPLLGCVLAHPKRSWSPVLILVAGFLTNAVVNWGFPHYFAPFLPAFFLLYAIALQHIVLALRRFRAARPLATAFVVAQAIAFCVSLSRPPAPVRPYVIEKKSLSEWLELKPGKDLVFVQYSPKHNVHHEWVYNSADLNASPVIWARSLGRPRDEELIRHFPDRNAWIVMADEIPARIISFDVPDHPSDTQPDPMPH